MDLHSHLSIIEFSFQSVKFHKPTVVSESRDYYTLATSSYNFPPEPMLSP